MRRGRLIVFEGPDGTGKTVLSRRLVDHLLAKNTDATYMSFPGREPGTLGAVVYQLHHQPESLHVTSIDPTSLQLLHVAAHVDAIERIIRPLIHSGTTVVLDRFWWSALVYGEASGAPSASLLRMVELEKQHWADLKPGIVFLIARSQPARPGEDRQDHQKLLDSYRRVMVSYEGKAIEISTDTDENTAFANVVAGLSF
jgi:thymidylate kinase